MNKLPIALHYMSGGYDTATDMLRRVPMRVIKFAELDQDGLRNGELMETLRLAKAQGTLVIGRRSETNPNLDAPDIRAETDRYFDGIGCASFVQMAQWFPEVDIWEGPNEIAISPAEPDRMSRYALLLERLAMRMVTEAHRPAALGGWSVGTPDFGLWKYWTPVLKACRDYHAVLSRHSYGPPLDEYYGLRHRRDEIEFRKLGFWGTPLIISECGADRLGDFPGQWREVYGGDIGRYWREYLKPYTEALMQDTYVWGATIFTCGNGGGAWDGFDIAHTDLAGAVLDQPPAPPVPPAPDGATHTVVNCAALNVRAYPWMGDVTPDVVRTLAAGARVRVYYLCRPSGMESGWACISPNRNEWVSAAYLAKL